MCLPAASEWRIRSSGFHCRDYGISCGDYGILVVWSGAGGGVRAEQGRLLLRQGMAFTGFSSVWVQECYDPLRASCWSSVPRGVFVLSPVALLLGFVLGRVHPQSTRLSRCLSPVGRRDETITTTVIIIIIIIITLILLDTLIPIITLFIICCQVHDCTDKMMSIFSEALTAAGVAHKTHNLGANPRELAKAVLESISMSMGGGGEAMSAGPTAASRLASLRSGGAARKPSDTSLAWTRT
jgi:hypothetical protein